MSALLCSPHELAAAWEDFGKKVWAVEEVRDGQDEFVDRFPHEEQQKAVPAKRKKPPKPLPPGPITTVMLSHISVYLTRDELVNILDMMGFKGRYDLVHMPLHFGSMLNKRLCFINFVDEAACKSFIDAVPVGVGPTTWSAKVANIQGYEANLKLASDRQARHAKNKINMPLVFPHVRLEKVVDETTPPPPAAEPRPPEPSGPSMPGRLGRWRRHLRVAADAVAANE